MIRTCKYFIFFAILLLKLFSCGNLDKDPLQDIINVKIKKLNIYIAEGNTLDLKEFIEVEGADKKDIKWEVIDDSDELHAAVDQNGIVKGIKANYSDSESESNCKVMAGIGNKRDHFVLVVRRDLKFELSVENRSENSLIVKEGKLTFVYDYVKCGDESYLIAKVTGNSVKMRNNVIVETFNLRLEQIGDTSSDIEISRQATYPLTDIMGNNIDEVTKIKIAPKKDGLYEIKYSIEDYPYSEKTLYVEAINFPM